MMKTRTASAMDEFLSRRSCLRWWAGRVDTSCSADGGEWWLDGSSEGGGTKGGLSDSGSDFSDIVDVRGEDECRVELSREGDGLEMRRSSVRDLKDNDLEGAMEIRGEPRSSCPLLRGAVASTQYLDVPCLVLVILNTEWYTNPNAVQCPCPSSGVLAMQNQTLLLVSTPLCTHIHTPKSPCSTP